MLSNETPDDLATQVFELKSDIENLKRSLPYSDADITHLPLDPDSKIRQAKLRKAMLMPRGNEDHDRFILEMFDHPHPVEHTLYFCRPSIQSHPIPVLEKLGASSNQIKRVKIVLEGYKTGRVKYTEVLNRHSIWSLLRCCPVDGFSSYRNKAIKKEHVLMHLDHLIEMVEKYENYNLVLTDAVMSVFFGFFEIKYPIQPEHFTIISVDQASAFNYQPSSFAISDQSVLSNLGGAISDMIWNHHSTLKDRHGIITELTKVRQFLSENGPFDMPNFAESYRPKNLNV